jgi:uracil phosphoribosyltransferase
MMTLCLTYIPLGGTIVAAIDLLIERGVTSKQIKVVSSLNSSIFI